MRPTDTCLMEGDLQREDYMMQEMMVNRLVRYTFGHGRCAQRHGARRGMHMCEASMVQIRGEGMGMRLAQGITMGQHRHKTHDTLHT